MRSVGDIIDSLGGNAAVARELGVNPSLISETKRRNNLQPKYWKRVIVMAERLGVAGVTAELLTDLHTPIETAVAEAAA